MDLIGDIIEHEPEVPSEPIIERHAAISGFPKLKTFDNIKSRGSRFKSGQGKTNLSHREQAKVATAGKAKSDENLTEAQRIHKENLEKISSLTEDELTKEREELLQGLDPRLIQTLLGRTEARTSEHDHDHAEGYDGWIGGGRGGAQLPALNDQDVNRALGIKSVSFKEEVEFEQGSREIGECSKGSESATTEEASSEKFISENGSTNINPNVDSDNEIESDDDLDDRRHPLDHFTEEVDDDNSTDEADQEIAPEGYQILSRPEEQPEVHFPKPKVAREDPDMDLNDPAFFEHLHEKYFPDLPKETSKLAWMTTPMPKHKVSSYEAIGDMRFDFKGNLVELDEKSQDTPTHLGLHHHSDNPQLAGYTLSELVHLTRSVVPTQRCLGIQMLGRILHKLGLHKYNIMPIVEDEDGEKSGMGDASREVMDQFEGMMWDLIDSLRVVESLSEASDEKRTRNLSVRSYAIEALWLWKQGGGRPKTARKSEEEILAENLQNM